MKRLLQILISVVIVVNLGILENYLLKQLIKKQELPEKTTANPITSAVQPVSYDAERAELEGQINSIIENEQGIWSVYVKNLKTGMTVEINNREFIAASVIKLFNMVSVYDEIEEGEVEMTNSLKKNIEQMITVSSNSASNAVVTTIGGGNFSEGAENVTELATELGCTNTYEQHMLYDDHIPSKGKNRTSVVDCGIVLEKIYLKQCVSPEYDAEMLEILKQQTRDYKIPANLPDDVMVANKTGENSNVEADVGIVFSPGCDYVICISVEKYGKVKPRDTIAEISECVYKFFNNKTKDI